MLLQAITHYELETVEVLTKDEEETLWKIGVLNMETPDGLLMLPS